MLYPQNGDRIVATDFVTSLHPVYIQKFIPRRFMQGAREVDISYTAYKEHG